MTGEPIAFWGLSIVLVGSALAVVLSKNLFHSVLWLALALTGTAGVFLLLDAEFLAAVQLLLYAGGVITIAVFAIVVTERLVGERLSQTNRRMAGGAIVSAVTLWVSMSTSQNTGMQPDSTTACAQEIQVKDGRITSEPGGRLRMRTATRRPFDPLSSMAKPGSLRRSANAASNARVLGPIPIHWASRQLLTSASSSSPTLEPNTDIMITHPRAFPDTRRA